MRTGIHSSFKYALNFYYMLGMALSMKIPEEIKQSACPHVSSGSTQNMSGIYKENQAREGASS